MVKKGAGGVEYPLSGEPQSRPLVIMNGRVIDPVSGIDGPRTVAIDKGVVKAVVDRPFVRSLSGELFPDDGAKDAEALFRNKKPLTPGELFPDREENDIDVIDAAGLWVVPGPRGYARPPA